MSYFGQMIFICLIACSTVSFAHENHQGSASSDILTVTGRLHLVKKDHFAQKKSERQFFVTDEATGQEYEIHFPAMAPSDLHPGARVEVRGHKLGTSDLLVQLNDGTSISQVSSTSLTAASVSGNRATLVLLIDSNDSVNSCTAAQVNDFMFTNASKSVKGNYLQASNQTFTFDGTTYEHVHINTNVVGASCDSNYSTWSSMARTAAQNMGISTSGYGSIVYVFPRGPSCSWAGLAYMPGGSAYITGPSCGSPQVYAHELGHNIGMDHARANGYEYGDYSDPMGSSSGLKTVNAPHKIQMGWLPSNKVQAVGLGTYTISALEIDPVTSVNPLTATVAKPDTNQVYYLSYRQPVGYDASVDSAYLGRLSIHTGLSLTNVVATLGDGQSFSDSVNGVQIQVVSHNADSITFSVTGNCSQNAPVVSLSPSIQGAAAGQSLNYVLSIQNRDSAYCAASTFNLSSALPAGFTGSLSVPSLSVAAGSSGSATLTLTSPSAAVGGTYDFTLNATAGTRTVSASGKYVIDNVAPSAPANLKGSIKRNKVSLSWSPATDNVGVVGYDILQNGAVIGTSTGSSFSSPIGRGTYTYTVRARDSAGNLSSVSNAVVLGK